MFIYISSNKSYVFYNSDYRHIDIRYIIMLCKLYTSKKKYRIKQYKL